MIKRQDRVWCIVDNGRPPSAGLGHGKAWVPECGDLRMLVPKKLKATVEVAFSRTFNVSGHLNTSYNYFQAKR